ncbi:hypothetical protein J6590_001461 [Homalodisca vitripennis]|nr:hypothetical protein J6590_001461 [Homalodisca vitripennis]
MKSQDSNISTGSFSNATESDIETAHVEEITHVPESEQVDEPLPSESNEGATSGAVSGNSSTSKRKVKRAFSKVGESSFELEATSYSLSPNSLSSDVLFTVTQGGNEDEEQPTYTDLTNVY